LTALDLVLRNARAATAADVFDCDIGIAGGRIVALGQGLPAGAREIDAAGPRRHAGRGRRALPPRPADGAAGAHGRRLRHRHARRGLRRHHHGDPVCGAGEGPPRCARRWTTTTAAPTAARTVDYAFHLIVSDPTPEVLTRELPALIARATRRSRST
jgi:dihydropyrimidinase